MKRILLLIILVVSSMQLSCATHDPAPRHTAAIRNVPSLQTLKKAIADHNKATARFEEVTKQFNDDFSQYEKDLTASHINHSNEQIDAYNTWQKYRNLESENAYLNSLTGGEYNAAIELEKRKKELIQRRSKLLDMAANLNKWRDNLKLYEEMVYRQLDFEERASARKEAILDNAFWHLYDQNMRMGDMMRQNALDRLWPR